MNFNERIFSIIMMILLAGCQKSWSKYAYTPDKKIEFADEISRKVAMQMRKEKDLYLIGTGSQMMNQIEMLALSFNYYKRVEIEEGRELLLSAVQAFMEVVNTDEGIRPYLVSHPFKSDNFEIAVFIQNSDHSSVPAGTLRVMSIVDGVLRYNIRDPLTDRLTTIYSETYEEAVQKNKGSAQGF